MISINLSPEDLALIGFIVLAIVEGFVIKHYYKKAEEYNKEIHAMANSGTILKPYTEVKTYDTSSNNNEILNTTENLGTPVDHINEGTVTVEDKETKTVFNPKN